MKANAFSGARNWFPQARFGVFVHLGLYTLLGENENKCRDGREPLAYEQELMPRFNPQRFNAEDWVRMIQDGGANYIVLTTKHCEGFCLWDTRYTRFKITNTPFKRDLVGEVAEAVHKHGLRLGLYFASDNWHYREPGEGTEEAKTYPGYVEAQLRELLTGYGQVDELWFDGYDARLTINKVRQLIDMIHTLQPSAVVSNRAVNMSVHGTCLLGDFVTPERMIPESLGPSAPFMECCDAMGLKSWGYFENERFWSVPTLVRRLSRVACMGGNYLLNIEPQPDGDIRPECVERLRRIGNWLNTHGQAVFGVAAGNLIPCDPSAKDHPEVGMSCMRGSTVYFHLHRWPESDEVLVKHVRGTPVGARLLGSNENLSTAMTEDGLRVTDLPCEPPNTSVVVMAVDFADGPKINHDAIAQSKLTIVPVRPEETVNLLPEAATRYGLNDVNWPRINRFANGNTSVGFMVYRECAIRWHLQVDHAGSYDVFADLGTGPTQKDAVFTITIAGKTIEARTIDNGGYDRPARLTVGELELPAGRCDVDLRIKEMPSHFSDVHRIVLQPVKHV